MVQRQLDSMDSMVWVVWVVVLSFKDIGVVHTGCIRGGARWQLVVGLVLVRGMRVTLAVA